MSLEAERTRFREFVRSQGLRMTPERLALFDEIFEQHGHIDAEQILRAMQAAGSKISRATVYRNLELLVECGLVRKHRMGGRRHLYEHLHRGQRHDHLVCRHCGKVVEFVSPGIEALQREILRAHGFSSSEHSLQILGLCSRCEQLHGAGDSALDDTRTAR